MSPARRVVTRHSERVASLLVLLCSLRTWGDRVEITTALRAPNNHPGRSGDAGAPSRRVDDGPERSGHAPRWVWPLWAAGVLHVLLAAVAGGLAPSASVACVAAVVPAALVDVRSLRIPNRWLGLAGLVLLAGVAVEVARGDRPDIAGVVTGALAFGGPLLVLHLVSPASMGFGDVKAAAVLGAALGLVHWHLALSALTIAAGLSVTLAALTRARTIPLGPGLVSGAAIALAASAVFLPPSEPAVSGGQTNLDDAVTEQVTT